MKTVKLFLVFAMGAQISCSERSSSAYPSLNINSFDISQNDSLFLFTLNTGHRTSIYQIGINGKNLVEIIAANDSNFYSPKYSKDNSKIIFIGVSLKTAKGNMYLADSDGSNRKIITKDNGMPTEGVLSECEDKIYYIKYSGYGGFNKQMHGADIYVMSLDGTDDRKVTNLNAYGLQSISEYDCENILLYTVADPKGGVMLFSKRSGNLIERINPKNSPREDLSLASAPSYSKAYNTMGFIVPFELYIMDMKTKNATLVVTNKDNPVYEFHFFKKQRRIAYVNENENIFHFVNLDGSNRKEVVIGQ